MDLNNILTLLEITVAASIFYVWVVRYENIVTEFKEYNYPDWFRDTIGILKLILVSTLVTQTTFLSICIIWNDTVDGFCRFKSCKS